jgi:hypothetical protein
MSTERNKTIVRRYWEEVWTQGNFAVMDELLASDFDRHPTPSDADFGHGPAGQKQLVGMYRTAFPDMHQWFDHTEEQRLWHLTFTFGRWLTASWSNLRTARRRPRAGSSYLTLLAKSARWRARFSRLARAGSTIMAAACQ